MQIKKENVKAQLIFAAREECLAHGYNGASLRTIAEKAGLSKGTIYCYFKNKDDLFHALTQPAIQCIQDSLTPEPAQPAMTFETFLRNDEDVKRKFKDFAAQVLHHKKSFHLLLFCNAGSQMENYKETIIQFYTSNFYDMFPFFHRPSSAQKGMITEMLIHTLASTYVTMIEEIILHHPTSALVQLYAEQMAIFVYSGIKQLYAHQEEKNITC